MHRSHLWLVTRVWHLYVNKSVRDLGTVAPDDVCDVAVPSGAQLTPG